MSKSMRRASGGFGSGSGGSWIIGMVLEVVRKGDSGCSSGASSGAVGRMRWRESIIAEMLDWRGLRELV